MNGPARARLIQRSKFSLDARPGQEWHRSAKVCEPHGGWVATLAAMVSGQVTVHKLLLAQGDQLATVYSVDALHAPSGAECPATATLP